MYSKHFCLFVLVFKGEEGVGGGSVTQIQVQEVSLFLGRLTSQ